jgi:hypothetical protein
MNYNQSDRDNRNFHSNRSERYRDLDQRSNMHFENYDSTNRNSYDDNDRNTHMRSNPGRYNNQQGYDNGGNYGREHNIGSERDRYASYQNQNSRFNSDGDNRQQHIYNQRRHGYESDFDSHGGGSGVRDVNYTKDDDLYGTDTSRRFQGSSQGRYNFELDNNRRSEDYRAGDDNYWGSGYRRPSNPDEYGFMNRQNRQTSSYSRDHYTSPTNRNKNYRGGHGPSSDYGYNRNRDMRDYDRY